MVAVTLSRLGRKVVGTRRPPALDPAHLVSPEEIARTQARAREALERANAAMEGRSSSKPSA